MNEEIQEAKHSSKPQVLLFLGVIAAVFFLLTTQISLRRSSYTLEIGDVATSDITAPSTITYVSDILTEQAKKDAEENVSLVYLPADPTISRTQVQNLRYTFQFLSTVRSDAFSTAPQKIADVNKLSLVRFDEATINQILDLSADDWTALQDESIRVLESVMQNSIRDTQLINEIANIPAMVNYYISQPIANLVTVFVSRFVVANSLYSEELTQKNIEEARDAVQNRERTFVMSQTVIQRGQIVTDLVYEALDKMGLVHSHNNLEKYISVICIIIGLSAFFLIFVNNSNLLGKMDMRDWFSVAGLFLIFLIAARLTAPNHTVIPFIFPIQALGMTISCLFGNALAYVFSLILGILVPYDFSNSANYAVFYIISSISAILILGKGRQINNFIQAGIFSGLIGVPVIIAYQYTTTTITPDTVGLLTLAGAGLISGIFSTAVALILQYTFSGLIGITTPIQLMEILRPESPLLQHLLRTAPGTYQHSLMVSNLAEQAARDIGADPLLTRAGAMYHDVGKSMNPSFFVENQAANNLDTHENMTPQETAAIIIQHVPDGVALIKKYHLPESMADFVRQHHGTNVTRFQLSQAIAEQGEENIHLGDFTYPGPRPQSKEAALIMLADTCEAKARADRPANEKQIKELVRDVFNYYSTSGQLDDTPLTLDDLTIARDSFARVLRNIYHPRVRYPNENKNNNEPKTRSTHTRIARANAGHSQLKMAEPAPDPNPLDFPGNKP